MTDHSPSVQIFQKNLMFIAHLLSRNSIEIKESEKESKGVKHLIEYRNTNV